MKLELLTTISLLNKYLFITVYHVPNYFASNVVENVIDDIDEIFYKYSSAARQFVKLNNIFRNAKTIITVIL